MDVDPLLDIASCDFPHVEKTTLQGSSREYSRKPAGTGTAPNTLSKHVAEFLRLKHVRHLDIVPRCDVLLQECINVGHKDRIANGGPVSQLDLDRLREYMDDHLSGLITNTCDDAGDGLYFIEASVEKEVETACYPFLDGILTIANRIAFFLAEEEVPRTVYRANVLQAAVSPATKVIPHTEFRVRMKKLAVLERKLLNPSPQTRERMHAVMSAVKKLRNYVYCLLEWKHFLVYAEKTFSGLVKATISHELNPTTPPLEFTWATCKGPSCDKHDALLAHAQRHCRDHSLDASKITEQFGLPDAPVQHPPTSSNSSQSHRYRSDVEEIESNAALNSLQLRLLQQLWMEALAHDQTFVAASTLNHSMFTLRQRSTRTLFISSVVSAHDPRQPLARAILGYVVCALNDAIARGQEMPDDDSDNDDGMVEAESMDTGEDNAGGEGEDPDGGRDENMGGGEGENGDGTGSDAPRSGSIGRSGWDVLSRNGGRQPGLELGEGLGELFPVVDSSINRTLAQEFLSKHAGGSLRMSIFNQIYQSQYPALLEPILPVDPLSAGDDKQQGSRPLPNVMSYPSRNYLAPLLVLTERVEEGVGLTFRGFIPFTDEEGNEKHVRIVAKLVQPGEDQLALAHEAKVYCSLQEADVHGIPCMIGVFHDIDDDLYVLVTTDMGRSFADAAPVASPSNSDDLRKTLSAIHHSGWIHGDIRLANLAQDAAARVSVFDFNCAKPNDHSNGAPAAEELAHALVLLKGIPADDSGHGYSF